MSSFGTYDRLSLCFKGVSPCAGHLAGWDTKVGEVISGFALNDSIASQLVTLRDLGAHKVGIPRNDFLWQSGSANGLDRAELSERVRWFPSQHEMRQRYEYNNWMWQLRQ